MINGDSRENQGVKILPWILAARPKTLPAAMIPVLVGSALAFSLDGFAAAPALLCLTFAVLIQIGTNFANDYFDWKQGADTYERIGPTRAVASGLIKPFAMLIATFFTLLTAFGVGLLLVRWGGAWLIGIGLASIFSAVAYTARPLALGYRGLGDVFVVFFFGIVAVCATAFVQLGFFPVAGWPVGLAIGLLANNLLVVNNYRDHESDAKAGKRTLIVRFGPGFGEFLVMLSLIVCILVTVCVAILWDHWLVFAALPGLVPIYEVHQRLPKALRREGYDRLLLKSALGLVLYGVLFSGGLLVRF